jgi:hypothetical protein
MCGREREGKRQKIVAYMGFPVMVETQAKD